MTTHLIAQTGLCATTELFTTLWIFMLFGGPHYQTAANSFLATAAFSLAILALVTNL